ncbi:acyloxyacyl hydrolase [uncultured Lutibacter sp.]|uniref:acyloxyacyl hydrolase n=1 Tax=uncultured Lutibacter sp. TaxID=437739 RepID=UPI0026166A09|nr:acyloxyacyl hydrolase [uncultured Lutibacter sp.]
MKRICILLFLCGTSWMQNSVLKAQNITIRPEILIGKTLPSNKIFPKTNPQFNIGLNFEKRQLSEDREWEKILNYPNTGISLYYSNFGNNEVLGNAVSLLPFILFNLNSKETLSVKFGLGASYFNKQYHSINNSTNSAISSKLTWALQAFIYYNISVSNFREFRIGAGYFHHSNGHTKLPNLGLNSVLFSVSTPINIVKHKEISEQSFDILKIKNIGDTFYTIRYGEGINEFIDYKSKRKSVRALEIYGGVYYKNIFKISLGLTYNFYEHYYDYIKENKINPYIKNPITNASNIYVSIGVEALLGNIGVDWEGGLNLYKPFYKHHYLLIEPKHDFKYELKKLFLGRLGLKIYAKNTSKKPINNVYIGAHINSNLSQADFTELSIGITHRIQKK